MFDFRVNILGVIKNNLPSFLWIGWNIDIFKVMAKPFRQIYHEFKVQKDDLIYKSIFNGEVIYLETALNDKFDNENRGITITDAFYQKLYIYMKSESKPPLILYRKWNSTIDFVTGKFCFYQGLIYESNTTPNVNKIPGIAAEWTLTTRKAPILRMKANFNGEIHFWVNVPSTVTFSENEMKALINYYKMAGLGYVIRTI